MKLVDAVGEYIKAKGVWTKCMQANFKQLCNRCGKLSLCVIYKKYVDSWLKLQQTYKDEK